MRRLFVLVAILGLLVGGCKLPGSSTESIQLGLPFVSSEFAKKGRLPDDDALTKEIFSRGKDWRLNSSWRYHCKWFDEGKGVFEIEVKGPNIPTTSAMGSIDEADLATGRTRAKP